MRAESPAPADHQPLKEANRPQQSHTRIQAPSKASSRAFISSILFREHPTPSPAPVPSNGGAPTTAPRRAPRARRSSTPPLALRSASEGALKAGAAGRIFHLGAATLSEPMPQVVAPRRNSCCAEVFGRLAAPKETRLAEQMAGICCDLFQVTTAVVLQSHRGPNGEPRTARPDAGGGACFTLDMDEGILSLQSSAWPPGAISAAAGAILDAARGAAAAAAAEGRSGEAAAIVDGFDAELLPPGGDGQAARFAAFAPMADPRGGAFLGTLALLDPSPRLFSDESASLLTHLAALVAREISQLPEAAPQEAPDAAFQGGGDGPGAGGGGDATLVGEAALVALRASIGATSARLAPLRRRGGTPLLQGLGQHAGVALVDGASPRGGLFASDDVFCKLAGGGRELSAGGCLFDLLRLVGEPVALAAAAASAGRPFEVSGFVPHRMGGSTHLKATCRPMGRAGSGGGGSGGGVYLAAVDFMSSLDSRMWAANGAPVRFRLLGDEE